MPPTAPNTTPSPRERTSATQGALPTSPPPRMMPTRELTATMQSTSLKADSRLTRLATWAGMPTRAMAAMMTMGLVPPTMAPVSSSCRQVQSAGRSPASTIKRLTSITAMVENVNVRTDSSTERGVAR